MFLLEGWDIFNHSNYDFSNELGLFFLCVILIFFFLIIGGQSTEREENEKHRMLKGMKKQLKHLLSQPVFKGLMKTKYPTQSGKLILSDSIGQHSQSALSAISKVQVKKVKKKQ